MSWHYLRGQEVASWEGASLDGAPSALSSLIPTRDPSSSLDSETDTSTDFRSGMTCEPSTATRGADMSTSCLAGSHAKTSAQPERARGSKARDRACGDTWRGSFVRYDHASSSWKTHQCSLLGGLESYSETWPRWGMMRGGVCWERATLAPHIEETGSGLSPDYPTPSVQQWSPKDGKLYQTSSGTLRLRTPSGNSSRVQLEAHIHATQWQTPTVSDSWKGPGGHWNSRGEPKLSGQVAITESAGGTGIRRCPTPTATDWKGSAKAGQRRGQLTDPAMGVIPAGGRLNPLWVAWLMGWPIGWTDLEPLEMDRFRQWLRSHGAC